MQAPHAAAEVVPVTCPSRTRQAGLRGQAARMKAAMRGTISWRKREPLKMP